MAELGGITASTLRAYISRGNSEVPQPQATVNGRDQWSRAVADDWVEARQRSHEGVRATMSAGDRDSLSPGAAEVRDHFADGFRSLLWDRPDVRKRWILRARNEGSVRGGRRRPGLGRRGQPGPHPAHRPAGPDRRGRGPQQLRRGHRAEPPVRAQHEEQAGPGRLVALLRAAPGRDDARLVHPPPPESAHAYIGEITHAAHDRWQIPAQETLRVLAQAVALDGKLSKETREALFALLTPPKTG
jgi:hypothetical protein